MGPLTATTNLVKPATDTSPVREAILRDATVLGSRCGTTSSRVVKKRLRHVLLPLQRRRLLGAAFPAAVTATMGNTSRVNPARSLFIATGGILLLNGVPLGLSGMTACGHATSPQPHARNNLYA